MFFSARRRVVVAGRHASLLAPQQQHELDSAVSTRIVHHHCLTPKVTDVWPRGWRLLAGGVDVAQWWLAGVVSGVVLVDSRGRHLWYDIGGAGG